MVSTQKGIPLVVVGAAGRMGRAVIEAASARPGFALRALVDVAANLRGTDGVWTSRLDSAIRPGMVVIEFSSPAGCRAAARLSAMRGAALVSGTTGLSEVGEAEVRRAGRRIPIVRASNFSLGIAALRRLLNEALQVLPGWDLEIVERHHGAKVDSPSGTAMTLAADAVKARGLSSGALRFGRKGPMGPRSRGEIGVHAVRGGTWIGDHTALLAGPGEWLELRHVAQDRLAFAQGALAAAQFLARGPRPGIYTIQDVLVARST